ncbi:MAG: ferritin family protein [Deltaproteobacteria bacterium]|nr:ferritin family protein [Deltaproteobacteria bacterium]
MSDETLNTVADGLLKAMQAEREGQHFYLMAAQTCQDPKGREIFEQLALEEQEHAKFLKTQYHSVLDTGRPDTTLKLGTPTELVGPNPIFSEKIRERLKDAHFEMTALSVGAQLELDAQKYYTERAAETNDVVIKTFYLELAEWEAGHYRALLAQQESLKEDYWSGSGFAPF